jgi:hypothetical protein
LNGRAAAIFGPTFHKFTVRHAVSRTVLFIQNAEAQMRTGYSLKKHNHSIQWI